MLQADKESVILLSEFWDVLKGQQEYYEVPTIPHPDPIFCLRTKPGYVFDDSFWEEFHKFPFKVCHVSYFGPDRPEGDHHEIPGIFELRWTITNVACDRFQDPGGKI